MNGVWSKANEIKLTRPDNLCLFQAADAVNQLDLNFSGQCAGQAIGIHNMSVQTFRFQPDLMVLLAKPAQTSESTECYILPSISLVDKL